jgi:hypothetical protein
MSLNDVDHFYFYADPLVARSVHSPERRRRNNRLPEVTQGSCLRKPHSDTAMHPASIPHLVQPIFM